MLAFVYVFITYFLFLKYEIIGGNTKHLWNEAAQNIQRINLNDLQNIYHEKNINDNNNHIKKYNRRNLHGQNFIHKPFKTKTLRQIHIRRKKTPKLPTLSEKYSNKINSRNIPEMYVKNSPELEYAHTIPSLEHKKKTFDVIDLQAWKYPSAIKNITLENSNFNNMNSREKQYPSFINKTLGRMNKRNLLDEIVNQHKNEENKNNDDVPISYMNTDIDRYNTKDQFSSLNVKNTKSPIDLSPAKNDIILRKVSNTEIVVQSQKDLSNILQQVMNGDVNSIINKITNEPVAIRQQMSTQQKPLLILKGIQEASKTQTENVINNLQPEILDENRDDEMNVVPHIIINESKGQNLQNNNNFANEEDKNQYLELNQNSPNFKMILNGQGGNSQPIPKQDSNSYENSYEINTINFNNELKSPDDIKELHPEIENEELVTMSPTESNRDKNNGPETDTLYPPWERNKADYNAKYPSFIPKIEKIDDHERDLKKIEMRIKTPHKTKKPAVYYRRNQLASDYVEYVNRRNSIDSKSTVDGGKIRFGAVRKKRQLDGIAEHLQFATLSNIIEQYNMLENIPFDGCCYNGGTCNLPDNSKYTFNSHGYFSRHNVMCSCPVSFTGKFCEIQVDQCFNKCKEREICRYSLDHFSCSCSQNYVREGEDCINRVTCAELPCLNGADCEDLKNGQFRCLCPLGFVGRICDIRVLECEDSSCSSEEICVSTENGYKCIKKEETSESNSFS